MSDEAKSVARILYCLSGYPGGVPSNTKYALVKCHPWLCDPLTDYERQEMHAAVETKPPPQNETRRIVVAFDIGRLTPNKRMNPRVFRATKRLSQEAALIGWRMAGSPVLRGVAQHVEYTICRGRVLDMRNASAALKGIEDSLFNRGKTGEGIGHDDSRKWILGEHISFDTGKCWAGNEQVIIEVTGIFEEGNGK